jgi:hypothetical protein
MRVTGRFHDASMQARKAVLWGLHFTQSASMPGNLHSTSLGYAFGLHAAYGVTL